MKAYALLSAIIIIIASLCFTGFQCGSAESTSAKLYMKNGDWVKAEAALLKDLEKNPDNAESWYNLARARLQLKKFPEMVEAYDKCLKSSGAKEFETLIANDKKSIWGSELNEGVKAYNASTKASPDSAKVLINSAVDAYKIAILLNPDSAISYQNLAIAYHVMANTDAEIDALKQALQRKQDPQYSGYLVNAYVTKAETAKKANNKADADANFANAIDALTAARAADPGNMELLSTLINVYIEAERATDALPFIREAVAKNPSNKTFQNDLGLLLMKTNDLNGAVEHFNAAVAADSSYLDGLRNGSIALMKLGQEARDAANKNADPKKGTTDRSYQEHFKQAAGLLKKYISVKKDVEPDIYEALATAYAGAGMNKEAQAALKQADDLRKK